MKTKTITISRKLGNELLKTHAALMGELTGKSYVGRSCEPASICRLAEALGLPTPDPELNAWIKPKRKKLEKILAEDPRVARNIGHLAWLLNQSR
jgi:hypothetical protein